MKKLLAVLLAAVMILCLTACGSEEEGNGPKGDIPANKFEDAVKDKENKDDPEQKENAGEEELLAEDYAFLMEEIAWAECYAAVGYIGYVEGPMGDGYGELFEESGMGERYPFVYDIPNERFVETAGYELYLIVPGSLDYSVKVVEMSFPENTEYWELIEGDTIYDSATGEPFILLCNESEVFTNVLITITTPDGTEKLLSPYLSGEDGSLCGISDDGLSALDITCYGDSTEEDFMVFDELMGEWLCDFYPGDTPYTVGLEFFVNDYGQENVIFWYGPQFSDIDEHYTGSIYKDYDIDGNWTGGYILDLFMDGGLFYDGTEYTMNCTYKFQKNPYDDGQIYVIHYGEMDPFFVGYENQYFEFYQPKG